MKRKSLPKQIKRKTKAPAPRRRPSRAPDVLTFVSNALDQEWNRYLKQLQAFQQKPTVKNVHDLRVSIRRLMTCMDLIHRFSPDNAIQKARLTLKDQLSDLSDLRDSHVEMVKIRGYLKQLPEIGEFYEELRDREINYLNAAKKASPKVDTKLIQNSIERVKLRLGARRAAMNITSAQKIINDTVDRAFDIVNQKLEYVTVADYSTIHSVRLAFKPLRYMLEMLQPLISLESRRLGTARSLSRTMGQIQDLEVLMKGLVEFKWKKDNAERAGTEIWLELERQKIDAARQFLRAVPKFGSIWKPLLQEQTKTKSVGSKTIYVLRHGIAVNRGDVGYPLDSDRPLTSKGIRRMRRVAAGMRRMGVEFDVTLTSPFRRALETAFVVGREYGAGESVQSTSALKPEVLPEEVVRALQENFASCRNLLLVGHEPQLSAFVSTLTSGSASARPLLKKGGLCKLQIEKLQPGKCATMLWLLTPRQLITMA